MNYCWGGVAAAKCHSTENPGTTEICAENGGRRSSGRNHPHWCPRSRSRDPEVHSNGPYRPIPVSRASSPLPAAFEWPDPALAR